MHARKKRKGSQTLLALADLVLGRQMSSDNLTDFGRNRGSKTRATGESRLGFSTCFRPLEMLGIIYTFLIGGFLVAGARKHLRIDPGLARRLT